MPMMRKKLLYLSAYRGFKEADVLMGGFVSWYLQTSRTDEELLMLKTYLEQDDAWLLEQMKTLPPHIPEDAINQTMDQISTLIEQSHTWYAAMHQTQSCQMKNEG